MQPGRHPDEAGGFIPGIGVGTPGRWRAGDRGAVPKGRDEGRARRAAHANPRQKATELAEASFL